MDGYYVLYLEAYGHTGTYVNTHNVRLNGIPEEQGNSTQI